MMHAPRPVIATSRSQRQASRVSLAPSKLLPRRPRTATRPFGRDLTSLRVAIVCDWLISPGGAERVTWQFHEMFPDAPIFTSQYDPTNFSWFDGADVRATWLQALPFGAKKLLPPLRALAFRQLDLSDYDLVLTSSGAESKALNCRSDSLQVTYCHSPSRYYWANYDTYLESPGLGRLDPIGRIGLRTLIGPMRWLDRRAAQRADVLVANSTYIRREIQTHYRRGSEVVFPPVDVDRFAKHARDREGRRGLVIAGRQTHYKRFDLAVEACTRLGLPLTVVGDGPEHDKLRARAGPTVRFERNVDDDEMPKHLAQAEGFLCPGVEAMATGTPVIAYRGGGALEYVRPDATGAYFDEPSVESLVTVLQRFAALDFDHERIRAEARRFTPETFRDEMAQLIHRQLAARAVERP